MSTYDPEIIRAAATAIANTRGARHGIPHVENILDLIPAEVRADIMEDATAVVEAIFLLVNDRESS